MMKFRKWMLAAGAVLMLAGCTQTHSSAAEQSSTQAVSTPETTAEKPDINVSELWHKYDQDPDKKTPTYDGDEETVTGVITYIGKDDHGTDSMEIADEKNGTSKVIAVFGSADEMASVSVGDTVSVSGRFHIMSSTDKVVLKQCQILKIYR